jgi:Icc-related predicted phosphoesterase
MYIFTPLLLTLLSFSSNRKSNVNKKSRAKRRSIGTTRTTSPKSNHPSNNISDQQLNIQDKRLKWALRTNAVFLIDLENVRGKSNFDLTHQELLKRTTIWANANKLQDQVSLIVDHGSIHESYYLPEGGGLSVVFAGNRMKADDVLARDVAYFQRNAIVITADNDLMSRCRNAMEKADGDHSLQFITPIKFISDLEILMDKVEKEQAKLGHDEDSSVNNEKALVGDGDGDGDEPQPQPQQPEEEKVEISIDPELVTKIDEEIKLRGSLYETETAMREKKNINTPKKRRKLEKRARQICERLAQKGGQNIDHLTTLDRITNYDRTFQDEVLSQWTRLRKSATRREMTGDRMLLAEHFRRQIELVANDEETSKLIASSKGNNDHQGKNSFTYAEYVKSLSGLNMATSTSSSNLISSDDPNETVGKNGSIRIVVVSDTHGYEERLTPGKGTLPPGDILLHLGDFAIDASANRQRRAIQRFDAWLARQPHRTKIVLRGNHDPFSANFNLSNANYVAGLKSIAIDGKISITLVPYSSPRKLSGSWRRMPVYCDILATHSPPHKVLDKCYHGTNAGCQSLRNKVERMVAGPPKLWLCGHIHEGRGQETVSFGHSTRETVVVNAANANSGRAKYIKYGPVVLDFHKNETMTILQGNGIIDSKINEEEKEEEKVQDEMEDYVLVPN